MGADFRVRPVRAGDAEELARHMRPEDMAEVMAAAGWSPLEAAHESLQASGEESWALELGGELAALFGLAPLEHEAKIVWALTTTVVENHRRQFALLSQQLVVELSERAPVMINFVDARYGAALRWAGWLGFHVGAPAPYGEARLPFVPIVYRRK